MKVLPALLLVLINALSSEAKADQIRWIWWPTSLLNPGNDLEIVEINLKLNCGEISAVLNVPSDWNVEVVRPVSGAAELHASAGHGGSHLRNLQAIDGVIGLRDNESSCFAVSAAVIGLHKEHELSQDKLVLRARPNLMALDAERK